MKTVRFVSTDKREQEFAAAVKKNVNDYFRKSGISIKGGVTILVQTAIMLLLYLLPFLFILIVPMNAWMALVLVVVMGFGMAGIGMTVMHDAVHGSYSDHDWVNKFFGGTMYILGSNVLTWKIQHNVLHHTFTNIEGLDQDIASKGPIRLSEHSPLRKIHYYQHVHAFFFYGLMTFLKLVRDFAQLIEFKKAGLTAQQHINPVAEYVKMVFTKLVYLFVIIGLPILLTPFAWWQVLLGFFLVHWTAGCILSTVFQMAHVVEGAQQLLPNKDGVIACEWAVHELITTADFARDNHFLNWYVGGLNFQIEHHLFPHVSHVHYRRIAPIVEKTAADFGLPYNLKPSLLDALKSHIRRLRSLGQTRTQVNLN